MRLLSNVSFSVPRDLRSSAIDRFAKQCESSSEFQLISDKNPVTAVIARGINETNAIRGSHSAQERERGNDRRGVIDLT